MKAWLTDSSIVPDLPGCGLALQFRDDSGKLAIFKAANLTGQ